MQIWETCFRDLCAANLKLGAVSSIDSKLSKKLKSTDLANQRHQNENKKTQIIIDRVIALWEAGNIAAGRGWKNYTECTDSIFQRPEINKSHRSVYGWISKHEQSKRTHQS